MKNTILLADDSLTIQRLVEQTFEEGHFDVVAVSNGDAALRKFEEVQPSLVLADIYMPGQNGYEVCAFVKGHPVLDHTPVVLLVGAYEAFDDEEAARVGASGKVTKPFEPQELLKLVSDLIEADSTGAAEMHEDSETDILGLTELFPQVSEGLDTELSEKEVEAIADTVIQRLSSEIIEGIAWDIVPDVAEKVVREELKRKNEY